MIRSIYFLIILFGCSNQSQEGISSISAEKLIELQKEGIPVVDVRTKGEFTQGHIPNALHIDFFSDDFVNRMQDIGMDDPIIIHCAVGGRSGKAAKTLKEAGFKRIYDYSGGFKDWKSKGYEIE